MAPLHDLASDRARARAMTDAFYEGCGVPCQLCDEQGAPLLGHARSTQFCATCRGLCAGLGRAPACDKVHLYGALQAERFGGQYIYFCPAGLTWFASPILMEGRAVGALVGGPVLMMEEDDFFAHGLFQRKTISDVAAVTLRAALSRLPRMAPSRVSALSRLLLASALSLGDGAPLLDGAAARKQQRKIAAYVEELKQSTRLDGRPGYPVEKEGELVAAITRGDQGEAGRLLNELLGHLMLAGGDDLPTLRTRVTELLVVLSRAAISGGADAEQIFGLNYRYLAELESQTDFMALCQWLSAILNRFVSLVFEVSAIKHRDIIYKAVSYIRANYAERITLESTAEYVGYSPSYFSRVFKADTGTSFNSYLNEYRIEKSKALLLAEGSSVMEVSQAAGFDDPGYFSKVFKRLTGVPPGRYRETAGRRKERKERDKT